MNSSSQLYEISRKINIFSTLLIVLFGVIGHLITIIVYSRKRFRTNSNHIYLLCLAINDSLFLMIHFLEDTVRTFRDVYITDTYSNTQIKTLLEFLNITDRFSTACVLINYLRYSLRFTSAYIIVVFTLQRLSIVNSPLRCNLKTKKFAWYSVLAIAVLSFLINLWVPFLFELQTNETNQFCDVNKEWSNKYFLIVITYIIFMLIPIFIIIISNSIIMYKTKRADLSREQISSRKKIVAETTNNNSIKIKRVYSRKQNLCERNLKTAQIKPFYFNVNTLTSQIKHKQNDSSKLSQMLTLVSFFYAILNLPYFIAWSIFFIKIAIQKQNDEIRDFMFALLQIFEILYILNYGLYFYINYASSSMFRVQLSFICEYNFVV